MTDTRRNLRDILWKQPMDQRNASENLDYRSNTVAAAWKPSNCRSFIDKAFGVFGRDRAHQDQRVPLAIL